MLPDLSLRERRAVIVGISVVAAAISWRAIVLPAARAHVTLRTSLERERALGEAELQLVDGMPSIIAGTHAKQDTANTIADSAVFTARVRESAAVRVAAAVRDGFHDAGLDGARILILETDSVVPGLWRARVQGEATGMFDDIMELADLLESSSIPLRIESIELVRVVQLSGTSAQPPLSTGGEQVHIRVVVTAGVRRDVTSSSTSP